MYYSISRKQIKELDYLCCNQENTRWMARSIQYWDGTVPILFHWARQLSHFWQSTRRKIKKCNRWAEGNIRCYNTNEKNDYWAPPQKIHQWNFSSPKHETKQCSRFPPMTFIPLQHQLHNSVTAPQNPEFKPLEPQHRGKLTNLFVYYFWTWGGCFSLFKSQTET